MPEINSAPRGTAPHVRAQDSSPSTYEAQSIDPAAAGFVDPYEGGYIDPSMASYAEPGYDPYGAADAPYPQAVSPIAGAQPAVTGGGVTGPTVQDLAALGIFTTDELLQINAMQLSPQELASVYDEAVAYAKTTRGPQNPQETLVRNQQQVQGSVQTPTAASPRPIATINDIAALGVFTDVELQQIAAQPYSAKDIDALYYQALAYRNNSPTGVASQPGAQAAGAQEAGAGTGSAQPAGTPAWNAEWSKRFGDMLKEQGLNSKTRLMVTSSLKAMGLDEANLEAAFQYYASDPAGKAELAAAGKQVRAGVAQQDKLMLLGGSAVIAAAAGTTALARSQGNLARVLTKLAPESDVAAQALKSLNAGAILRGAAPDVAALLRSKSAVLGRFRNPVAKLMTNAAARHVTPAVQVGLKESLAVGMNPMRAMKVGEGLADAAAGAAKVAAGGADDVAKAAGGVAAAAKGAGMLSKLGKAIGPIGLVASAAFGAWGVKQTMDAEGEFGEESAKMTGNVVGGLAGGVAGAAAGFAIGSAIMPVIGSGIGSIVGGIVGGIGVGKIGEGIGGMLHGMFD